MRVLIGFRGMLGAAAMLATLPSLAQATSYSFTVLTVPGLTGGDTPQALSLNNVGDVVLVGGSSSGDTVTTVYNLNTHTYTPIPSYPGAPAGQTAPGFINNAGQIAGSYLDTGVGTFRGFLYSGGSFTQITPPFATHYVSATGINNLGQIAGTYDPGTSVLQGFVRSSGGTYTSVSLSANPDIFTIPIAINDSGTLSGITGSNSDPNGAFAGFIDDGGTVTTIAIPGALDTYAQGINNAGTMVGFSTNTNNFNDGEGFIFSGGVVTIFNVPGSLETQLSDINDLGQIVGDYTDANGVVHAFIATPVPEPATLALSLFGLAGLAFVRRARS